MHEVLNHTVVRTGRGLSIAGTRITIYQLIECLKAGQSTIEVQQLFNLSDRQMADVLDYITRHARQVEEEYQEVLRQAEENRAYWEERNRERLLAISKQPPSPGKEALHAKLKKRKSQLGMS